MKRISIAILPVTVLCSLVAVGTIRLVRAAGGETDWPGYGGGPADIRYSPLEQINASNVSKLRAVWSYDTDDGRGDPQTQPIMIDGVLFGLTPRHKVVALDAASGKLLWRFDSGTQGRGPNRSVVYWAAGDDKRISRRCKVSSMRWTRRRARPSNRSGMQVGSTSAKAWAATHRKSPWCSPVPA